MTKVQHILEEINHLNKTDLELILKKILEKVEKEKEISLMLQSYKGIGKGIWNIDAQQMVNDLRNQDRL